MIAMYTKGREAFMRGEIDLLSDDIRAVLVDEGMYTPDLDVHQFLDAFPFDAQVGEPTPLTGRQIVRGSFRADNTIFHGLAGNTAEFVVLHKAGTTRSNSPLIAIFDAHPVINPTGDDVTVLWPKEGLLSG